VHTLTVTHTGGGGIQVLGVHPGQEGTATTVAEEEGPSPIAPEFKELLWGFGAFVVFLFLMRLFLFPKVKKGMEARRAKIRSDHEAADATRFAAQSEVAEYQAQLASVKAEASARIDAARQQLESERAARTAEVNAGIAQRRAAAAADADAALTAARQSVESAVGSVAARAVELAVGARPDAAAVQRAVRDAMSAGVVS